MSETSRRALRPLPSFADLPSITHPGTIHIAWSVAALSKGFVLIGRVYDKDHLALRCLACGSLHIARRNVVTHFRPQCLHCLDLARRTTARAAGLIWLRRDPASRHYSFYRAACDHEVRRQFVEVGRIADGEVALRCDICLIQRESAEARVAGWERISRDPEGNPNYRIYRHSCGHEQRSARANMQWSQCDCAGCGLTWTAKPSFIYLLEILHQPTNRHFLKLGYSARPVKRHRHQLGLPPEAAVEVLRVVAMPTGHLACALEKKTHAALRLAYPGAVVPNSEYVDLINVISEIYRPALLRELHRRLDLIEAEVAITLLQSAADRPDSGSVEHRNTLSGIRIPRPTNKRRPPSDQAEPLQAASQTTDQDE